MSNKLKTQLEQADLRLKKADGTLKRVERWVQLVGLIATAAAIVSTVVSIKVSHLQGKLFETQTTEANEKHRVSYTFRLIPGLMPDGRRFYVRSKMTNLSGRELNLLMIGIRV